MDKKPKRPRDPNQLAKAIVAIAIADERNPTADSVGKPDQDRDSIISKTRK